MKKRIVPPSIDQDRKVPLSKLINFGPVTLGEFEAMGFKTLDQLDRLDWEEVCRQWVENFPERLNVNAFIGVIATFEGISWTKINPSQRTAARNLVNRIRRELNLPPAKPPKKKTRPKK